MKKLEIINQTGTKVKDFELNEEVFNIKPNDKVLKDAIVIANAALRQGTAKTKNRAEVSGGGRKPWKQKGTGHARQGSIRAVQWKGGGVAFGPIPRSYSKKQNKKEAKLAIKSAYSYKIAENKIIFIDKLELKTPRTKEIKNVFDSFKINNKKVLIILNEYSENVILASRNLNNVLIMKYNEASVLDIIASDYIIIEGQALDKIEEVLK